MMHTRRDFIAVSLQFEYGPDGLTTKVTAQLVHKSNGKTFVLSFSLARSYSI